MFALKVDDDLELRLLEHRHAVLLFELTVRNCEHLRPFLPWVPDLKEVSQTESFIRLGSSSSPATTGFKLEFS